MITLSKTNFTDCTANLFQGDVHQANSAANYLVLALNLLSANGWMDMADFTGIAAVTNLNKLKTKSLVANVWDDIASAVR